LAAVEQFLTGYRDYAKVASKRRADRVLQAHDEYEAAIKEVLEAEAECDRSLAELARLKAELQRFSLEEHTLEAEITALQQSSQTLDGQALERARREAIEKRRDAESVAAEFADSVRSRKSCQDEHFRIRDILEQCRPRLAAASGTAQQVASS